MQTEIEAKFLDIDPDAVRETLKSVGATLIHPERLMRRRNFHFPADPHGGAWIRVRDEGDRVTMSYKKVEDHRHIHGTKEITVEVSDFEKTCTILATTGLIDRSYQETKRERWQLGDTEITLDIWPWIPTFVELEGPNERDVGDVASRLGLEWGRALFGAITGVYRHYFDFSEEQIDDWGTVTFAAMPDWIAAKRRRKPTGG